MAEHAALGSVDGTAFFEEGPISSAGSLVAGDDGRLAVPSRTLDSVLASTGPIDLLKLDVEGAGFDVLGAASDETLGQIGAIVGELHLESRADELEPLAGRLRALGFEVACGRRRSTTGPRACVRSGAIGVASAASGGCGSRCSSCTRRWRSRTRPSPPGAAGRWPRVPVRDATGSAAGQNDERAVRRSPPTASATARRRRSATTSSAGERRSSRSRIRSWPSTGGGTS